MSIKVGYLPLYIKLYDDATPARRPVLEKYTYMLQDMIRSFDIEVVASPTCRIKPEFEAAIELFHKENVDAIVTQHLAYSPSLESIDALEKAGVPLIVLDTTPDYALLDMAGYQSGISPNHGIHGVQDMCNLLKRRGIEYYLCVGHAMHSDVIAQVAGMCRAAAAAKAYKTARVGSVGGSFTGMGDFLVSDEDYKAKIGAEVSYMDTEAVKKYLPKVTDEEIEREILRQALEHLGERERSIIKLRFGLGGQRERTQKEVADRLGISQSYISRLEKRIILRLRRELQKMN